MTAATEAGPFLKWAGGKRQLLPVLRTYYPRRLSAYHEPFLGSGAVFFDLLAAGRLAGVPVWLSDGNPDLVGCYLRVRDSVDGGDWRAGRAGGRPRRRRRHLLLRGPRRRFNPARAAWAAAGARPETYGVELAAALLYLNRTGYNGLFRLNQSGGYNVPAGTLPASADRAGRAAAGGGRGAGRPRRVHRVRSVRPGRGRGPAGGSSCISTRRTPR